MIRKILVYITSALLMPACALWPEKPIRDFEFQTPRPFGYLIGDEICHRILIETGDNIRLIPDSAPKKGEINHWLRLNQVTLHNDDDGRKTTLELCYQVFYAAKAVKMLTIPGYTLRFTQTGKSLEQVVPAWHFTLSPLKEAMPRKDANGYPYLRPDTQPLSLTDAAAERTLLLATLATLSAGVYLAHAHGYIPLSAGKKPFKRAVDELSALSPPQNAAALSRVHEAINTLHGRPLFSRQLGEFFRRNPEYQSLAGQFEWFFNLSNRFFFAGGDISQEDWHKLRQFCRQCREIERGSR